MPLCSPSKRNDLILAHRALWQALLELGDRQKIRVYRLDDASTKWKEAVWVFRDTLRAETNSAERVEYFADGRWHPCVEGVRFDAIKPWRMKRGVVPSVAAGGCSPVPGE